MTKEALNLALGALTNAYWPTDSDLLPAHNIKECGEAITAIKAALLSRSDGEAKDEPMEFFDWYDNAHWGNEDFKEGCHRAWNAAIKYTAKPNQEAKDEPVAWMFQHEETGRTMCVDAQQLEWGFEKGNPRLKKIAPLYTTPPQRKPLTDEQIEELWDSTSSYYNVCDFARAIEAAHGIKGEA